MLNTAVINDALAKHPYPLLFVTVSGAHLYGFASPDSDYDLRGAHITPVSRMVGLVDTPTTHEMMDKSQPIEIDLVTHDIRKFFTLLLKNNGYVLEQVCSPLCVAYSSEFDELKALAPLCITRHHHHHFRNFADNQWQAVVKNGKPTVKGLLYTYRVLLAGIHLMRTKRVESNLQQLNQDARLGYIDDLIDMKMSGCEKQLLQGTQLAFHESEFLRLKAELDQARDASDLPEQPSCRDALDQLLIRIRLKHL